MLNRRTFAPLGLGVLALFLFSDRSARADTDRASLLAQANDAYQHGDYALAAIDYQRLVEEGVTTPDVYFNLGTARLKAGDRGEAILAFERALKLDPSDADAAFNVAEAEKGNIDKIVGTSEEEPLLERIGSHVPVGTLGMVFLLTWVAGNIALMVRWLLGRRASILGVLGGLAVAIAILSGPVFFIGAWERSHSRYAVVTSPSAAVREGPAADFKSAFEIHEGLKVRIVRREQGFIRVRLANGIEGWVSEKDAPTI
jgi:tetratricopeptide (TPR) repeat protein